MSKKKVGNSPYVYSTDPNFVNEINSEDSLEILASNAQKIRVSLQTKHRAGKAVTLIENFSGTENEKLELGKKLKSFCGTGGSVKDGEIIVQGDNRDKIVQWLHKNGYTSAKKV